MGASACPSIPVQEDKDIVLAAVKQDWRALKYASATLQADKTVVLTAVMQNGNALQFVGYDRQDQEIVLAAVTRDGRCVTHATNLLQRDPAIVVAKDLFFQQFIQAGEYTSIDSILDGFLRSKLGQQCTDGPKQYLRTRLGEVAEKSKSGSRGSRVFKLKQPVCEPGMYLYQDLFQQSTLYVY